ncbi:MAG: DNA methyltransferase [Bacteroidota bacterium]|nr:DNA methyltransferase [Bacteroidota bacterium]
MTEYLNKLLLGDTIEVLKRLPSDSVDLGITSPPYNKGERNNPHPAPFPIELPTRIIYSLLNEDKGVVIDPYCGSGTTLVAAKLLNKDFIGIDISEDYISFTKERLEKALKEKRKVEQEVSRHFVEKTFKERKANKENTGKFRNHKEKASYIFENKEQDSLLLF